MIRINFLKDQKLRAVDRREVPRVTSGAVFILTAVFVLLLLFVVLLLKSF